MTSNFKKGLLLALTTSIFSGLAIFYNKLIIIKGIDPLVFNIYKNGGVAFILSLLVLSKTQREHLTKLSKNSWLKLILIALIGGSIPFILYFEGLKTVSALNANLIHKTLFIWVVFLAIPLLGEKIKKGQFIGYLLVAASNFFIGGFKGFSLNTAEAMILAATIFWATENVIAKNLLYKTEGEIVAWGRMFLGSLILFAYAFFQNKLNLLLSLNPQQILPVLGSIFFLFGYVLTFYKSLKYIPVTLSISVLVLATPITNILTAIFITHNFPQIQFLNFILTISGITLITVFSFRSRLTNKQIAST